MGAFMAALGPALATAGKAAVKGVAKFQKAKGNLLGQQSGGQQQQRRAPMQITPPNVVGSKKKGGPIRKTGLYHLHAGEFVIPAKHSSSSKRASRKRAVIKA